MNDEKKTGKETPKTQMRKGLASVFSGGAPGGKTVKTSPKNRSEHSSNPGEKNPMGRPNLFNEPTKIKAVNEPLSFLVNLQLLANKRQRKTGRGGNVSELLREIIQPIIEEELGEDRCKPNEYPDWFRI